MKKIAVLFCLFLLSAPSFAADAPPAPADMKERLALAAEFQKLRPIKNQIDLTIGALGTGLTFQQQQLYMADMRKNFDYKKVDDASIKALAETFTVPELTAMVDYYKKPEGQSAAAKMSQYQDKLKGTVAAAIDAAITKIKYDHK